MSFVALAFTALGVVGGLVALLAPVVYWLHKTHVKHTAAVEELGTVRRIATKYESSIADHKAAVAKAQGQAMDEFHARQQAERQRDTLLQKMVESGDPDSIAAAINDELSALSSLSDLPAAASATPPPTPDGG